MNIIELTKIMASCRRAVKTSQMEISLCKYGGGALSGYSTVYCQTEL